MPTRFFIRNTTPVQLAAVAVALLGLSACAETGGMPSATSMRLGDAAFAPQGYIKFCERRPDQCGLPSPIAEVDRVKLERTLNQQQWANVFNLKPTSITAPVLSTDPTAGDTTVAPASLNADDPSRQTTASGPDIGDPFAPFEVAPVLQDASSTNQPQAIAPEPARPIAGKDVLHMTPLVWAALNGINQSVNDKIKPMSDEQAFGISDYWTLPLSDGPRPFGNCKHYALEKRKALVDAGFSADALSIAIVKTGWGEVHAVLIVDTDQGDYVLDNLSPWIKGWQDVRYTWVERQTPGAPLRWAAVAGRSDPLYRSS